MVRSRCCRDQGISFVLNPASVSGIPRPWPPLTFPLTEAEQRAAGAAHVVLLKRRKRRRPRLHVSGIEELEEGSAIGAFRIEAAWVDLIAGQKFSLQRRFGSNWSKEVDELNTLCRIGR